MATVTSPAWSLPGTRYDHRFFPAMVVLLTASVATGFARTYFLAGVFQARLPGILIHIHGAVFTAWFVLLLVQSALAASGRIGLHRTLGITGIVIASAMVPLGVLATAEYIRRMAPTFPRVRIAAIMPLAEILSFAVLAAAAFLLRLRPDWHKRLILLATIALIGAALGRMDFLPYFDFRRNAALRLVWAYTYVFCLVLAAYDVWALRRIHRATLSGSGFLIAVHQVALLVNNTAP